MVRLIALIVFVFGLIGMADIALATQDNQDRPQVRVPNERLQQTPVRRPGNNEQEGQPQAQSANDWMIIDLYNRWAYACTTSNTVHRSIILQCPDGSTITVEMDCDVQGTGGTWPNCTYREDCRQTNSEACPPVEREPED